MICKRIAVLAVLLAAWTSPAAGVPFQVEPDDYTDRTVLNTIHPGVTLASLNGNNDVVSIWNVTANVRTDLASTGDKIFGCANVPFWNDDRRLKMTFTDMADWVSIDFIGGTNFATNTGCLKIYNAGGQLLDYYETVPLNKGSVETMTLSRAEKDIAYAIAYVPEDEGSFGRLDNLQFLPEPASAALMLLGVAGILGRARRKR